MRLSAERARRLVKAFKSKIAGAPVVASRQFKSQAPAKALVTQIKDPPKALPVATEGTASLNTTPPVKKLEVPPVRGGGGNILRKLPVKFNVMHMSNPSVSMRRLQGQPSGRYQDILEKLQDDSFRSMLNPRDPSKTPERFSGTPGMKRVTDLGMAFKNLRLGTTSMGGKTQSLNIGLHGKPTKNLSLNVGAQVPVKKLGIGEQQHVKPHYSANLSYRF